MQRKIRKASGVIYLRRNILIDTKLGRSTSNIIKSGKISYCIGLLSIN